MLLGDEARGVCLREVPTMTALLTSSIVTFADVQDTTHHWVQIGSGQCRCPKYCSKFCHCVHQLAVPLHAPRILPVNPRPVKE